MPRVSPDHLAARRRQILDAAWRCFARQGFHATSMHDVFAEAGLSAGAVYRYFPSKSDLVRTTADGILAGAGDVFERLLAADPVPSPHEALRTALAFVIEPADGEFDRTRIALHVWSEALRDEEIRRIVGAVATEVRQWWYQLAERWRAYGYLPAGADLHHVASTLYGVMIGFVVQRQLLGDVNPDDYAAGLANLIDPRR